MAGMLAFFTRAGNGTGMTEGGSWKSEEKESKESNWKKFGISMQ